MAKSICVTYLLWLIGGFFGLHHFYLRRYKQALVWWCLPGGYFGVGWFRDLWRIPEYVRDANNDPAYILELTEKMRKNPKPPISFIRWGGQLALGNTFHVVLTLGIPNSHDLGINLHWIALVFGPFAMALGIWLVGNIGRHQGSIKPVLLVTYLMFPLEYFGIITNTVVTIAGIMTFEWKCKQWRRTVREPLSITRVLLVLTLCGGLYSSLWVSYMYFNMRIITKDGDDIPLREAVGNFIKSPAFQEFSRNVKSLWNHVWEHGFKDFMQQLIESLDPLGEKNALKVLNLTVGVSQDEVKHRYRELTKIWHPDKVQDPDKKEEAQEKFVEIQKAYETLSDIKIRRSRQNKRNPKS